MPSQVSGGFWLQVPNDLHNAFRFTHPTKIALVCHCTKHEEGFIYQVSTSAKP